MNYKVGDIIRIIHMDDNNGKDLSAARLNGKEGRVTYIDSIGQLHGTWGGLAVIPEIDEIELCNDLDESKASEKVYNIIRTHYSFNGTERTYVLSGTLEELIKKYSYTLECGKSYENERGNKKINMHPKTIESLCTNLENAANNSAANGYSGDSYRWEEIKDIQECNLCESYHLNEGQEVKLSERAILKLDSKAAIIEFFKKYENVNTFDRLMRFVNVVSAIANIYKFESWNGDITIFGQYNDTVHKDDSLYIVPKNYKFEVYGDDLSWTETRDRYRTASTPKLMYHYLDSHGYGNTMPIDMLSERRKKEVLSMITPKYINIAINDVADKILEKRRGMILNGEIKTKNNNLSTYGFDNVPTSYVQWAKQYLKKFLDVYGKVSCKFATYTGEIQDVHKANDNYFVNLYMQNNSTDTNDVDFLDQFMNNSEYYYSNYGFRCRVSADDKEECFKKIYNNAKTLFRQYKK